MQLNPSQLLARVMRLENTVFGNNGSGWITLPLAAGVTNIYTPKYQMITLNGQNYVHLTGQVSSPATPANPFTLGTLQSGYYSTTRDEHPAVVQLNPTGLSCSAALLRVVSNGTLAIYGVTAASIQINMNCFWPVTS